MPIPRRQRKNPEKGGKARPRRGALPGKGCGPSRPFAFPASASDGRSRTQPRSPISRRPEKDQRCHNRCRGSEDEELQAVAPLPARKRAARAGPHCPKADDSESHNDRQWTRTSLERSAPLPFRHPQSYFCQRFLVFLRVLVVLFQEVLEKSF